MTEENTGKIEKVRWTDDEIQTFNRLAAEGKTLTQIAAEMPNRSEIALLSRSRKFGTRVSQRRPFNKGDQQVAA